MSGVAFPPPTQFEHQRQMAAFVEARVPIRVIAHLTFQRRASRERAGTLFTEFIKCVGSQYKLPVGHITSFEQRLGVPLHLHTALVLPRPVSDLSVVVNSWKLVEGENHMVNARVERYQSAMGGLAYILKLEDADNAICDVVFSKNLGSFMHEPPRVECGDQHYASKYRSWRRVQALMAEPVVHAPHSIMAAAGPERDWAITQPLTTFTSADQTKALVIPAKQALAAVMMPTEQ